MQIKKIKTYKESCHGNQKFIIYTNLIFLFTLFELFFFNYTLYKLKNK